jgi:hypothetical protein
MAAPVHLVGVRDPPGTAGRSEPPTERDPIAELRRALNCLYLETAPTVVEDVKRLAKAALDAGREEGRREERARCVQILHEEGWVGRSEQRIAHPIERGDPTA